MTMKLMRRAAAATALAAALAGCSSGSSSSNAVDVDGRWSGTLALGYVGGGGLSGGIGLQLSQTDDFASGGAQWAAVGEAQSVTMAIDGADVTLYLHFRCAEGFEIAQLRGSVNGDAMRLTRASGLACALGGQSFQVGGGDGTLARANTNTPP